MDGKVLGPSSSIHSDTIEGKPEEKETKNVNRECFMARYMPFRQKVHAQRQAQFLSVMGCVQLKRFNIHIGQTYVPEKKRISNI